MSKGKPIPVRFEEAEAEALADLAKRTGLPVADIIRRCVRLLAQEVERRGAIGFILDLTSLNPQNVSLSEEAGGAPPAKQRIPWTPPQDAMRVQAIPEGSARGSARRGVSTPSLNESEERPKQASPPAGQPRPKSTAKRRGPDGGE